MNSTENYINNIKIYLVKVRELNIPRARLQMKNILWVMA